MRLLGIFWCESGRGCVALCLAPFSLDLLDLGDGAVVNVFLAGDLRVDHRLVFLFAQRARLLRLLRMRLLHLFEFALNLQKLKLELQVAFLGGVRAPSRLARGNLVLNQQRSACHLVGLRSLLLLL